MFYPTASESKLRHYTSIFPTVEIDSTFYAFPVQGTVIGWDRYSPRGFVFNVKMPQDVTHEKLNELGPGIEADMDRFAELMQPLNNSGKLGCILLQLPPSYRYGPDHLESFLAILPHGYKYAIEFRNKTWLRQETWKILEKYGLAYTIVDEPLLPPEIHVTTDFAFIRWHGHGNRPWYNYHYTDDELKNWVPKIKEVSESVKTVYGYFNNHFHGYAVENCLRILDMLGQLTPEQEEALGRAQVHLGKMKASGFGLGKWLNEDQQISPVVEALGPLMGESRLTRALEISKDEIDLGEVSLDRIEARIRKYMLKMDLKTKSILHDCGDWERAIETRQLCKHVGRVLLSVPPEIALAWVNEVRADPENWSFQRPK